MDLGNSLFNARKKSGLSQEDVAEKLGVSRQTIVHTHSASHLLDKLEFIDNSTYFTPCISPYLSFRLSIPLITERKHD